MTSLPYGLLSGLALPIRRKVFVSYHHAGDQWYYDEFTRVFHEQYEAVYDNSLERAFDSSDTEYVMRRIRENHIHGTSCTIVLCGAQTPSRKYVDWEIKATLDKEHGLIGIQLPSLPVSLDGKVNVPERLNDNIKSGYAVWIGWTGLNLHMLNHAVEAAVGKEKWLISNTRQMKQRNG